jgi:hypothetical protein
MLRTIIVCVDYADLLAITLPYNRHHFSEVMIVTSFSDEATVKVASDNGALIYQTNAFYTDGASFNKFRALEEGLDVFGRYGWMCIMDADVLWPKHINWDFPSMEKAAWNKDISIWDGRTGLISGNIYTPLRRMCEELPMGVPHEPYWKSYPLHPQQQEFAGYTQIFHAEDPHLPPAPWHQTNWKHAGGADSFFQALWPTHHKIRPPFECLHLGRAGVNWAGRVTPFMDGTQPAEADTRLNTLRNFMKTRRETRSFDSEKF